MRQANAWRPYLIQQEVSACLQKCSTSHVQRLLVCTTLSAAKRLPSHLELAHCLHDWVSTSQ